MVKERGQGQSCLWHPHWSCNTEKKEVESVPSRWPTTRKWCADRWPEVLLLSVAGLLTAAIIIVNVLWPLFPPSEPEPKGLPPEPEPKGLPESAEPLDIMVAKESDSTLISQLQATRRAMDHERQAHEVEAKKAAVSVKQIPQQEYEKAYTAYEEHRYDEALTLFKDFLQRYPNHDLADNAQYWIGEIYYDLEDYGSAILAFKGVVTRYAEENKTPDALLKIGYTYIASDDPSNARIFLKRVINNYPFSEVASKARAKLKELKNP
jgi:tol-pal system protein YbgF